MRWCWTRVALLGACAGCTGKSLAPVDVMLFEANGDSADSGDPGTTVPAADGPGTSLTVAVAGDIPKLGMNLHTVVFGAEPDAPLEIADAVLSGSVASIAIDKADARWVQELGDGTRGFATLPFVYIDDDDNGVHTPEEQYIGLGLEGALYVDGTPGAAIRDAGFDTGWTAFSVELTSGVIRPHAPGLDGLSLEPQLIPQDRLLLEATYAGAPEGLRVAMVPETVLDGVVDGPLIFDQPVSSTVQIPIEGPPPDTHLQDWGADGTQYRDWRYGVEFLVLYEDIDSSGDFAMTDTIVGMGCVDGVVARWQHSTEPDRAFEALYLATYEIIPAWSLWLDRPEGAEYIRVDDSPPILLSDACLP